MISRAGRALAPSCFADEWRCGAGAFPCPTDGPGPVANLAGERMEGPLLEGRVAEASARRQTK
eukprot:6445019-Alexandrium_andersonii.AAC.1